MTGNGSARASGNQPSGSQASGRGSARASGNQPSGSQASGRGSARAATVTRASGSQASGSRLSGSQAGAAQERISVFLLDDHEIVRRGLRDLLSAEPDIDVIGEAGTAESALARMPALRPGVAVLDVRLPDGDGVSVCREIRSTLPGTACLMLT